VVEALLGGGASTAGRNKVRGRGRGSVFYGFRVLFAWGFVCLGFCFRGLAF
jgi:hypothetical protein